MLTVGAKTSVTTPPAPQAADLSTSAGTQKVVIVNGGTGTLELFETMFEAGRYEIVFVESNAHAYSQIKRVHPNLVILCVRIEDVEGFQVLSMLKLDEETREIPVLTYTTEYEGQESEDEAPEPADAEIFSPKPAMRMN